MAGCTWWGEEREARGPAKKKSIHAGDVWSDDPCEFLPRHFFTSTTHMPKPECFSPWANAKISFVDFETGLQQIDIDINGTQSAAVTPPDSGIYHQTVS